MTNNISHEQKLIHEFHSVIMDTYKKHNLTSLRGIHNEHELNGKALVQLYYDTVRKGRIKNIGFNYETLFDDILNSSDKIMFFLANLFLYRPYINNPLATPYLLQSGTTMYQNIQNLEGKRFSMFSDVVGMELYNYWDRIGDLIASYFPNEIKVGGVFFSTAINIIPKEFHSSNNYKWLNDFRNSSYKEINEKKIDIVHYIGTDTDYNHKHLKNYTDKDAMEKIHSEKVNLPEFYNKHFNLTFDGFEKTLSLIEEITKVLLFDIA